MDVSIILTNVPPKMRLECPHCGIVKANIEEMEIHLKVDHIGWLPFQCPACHTVRATDGQMREHVFAAHNNSADTQFLYNDNKEAKKELQLLVHKSLFLGVHKETQKTVSVQAGSPTPTAASNSPVFNESMMKPQFPIKEELGSPKDSPERPAQEANLQLLNLIFGQGGAQVGRIEENVEEEADDHKGDGQNDVANIMDLLNAQMAIQNMAMMFPATPMLIPEPPKKQRRKVKCASCIIDLSPSTRFLHTYYHLQNDYNEARFRCLFENCDMASHRKDPVEIHLLKVHQTNSADYIEDRAPELHDLFKKVYAQLFPEQTPPSVTPDEEPVLEKDVLHPIGRNPKKPPCLCVLCHEFYDEKDRGDHVRLHLIVDTKVARFACSYCDFKHQERDEVVHHAEQVHVGMKDAVEDTINDHLEELESIANHAFGIPYLAACLLENKKEKKNVRRSSNNQNRKRAAEPEPDESSKREVVKQSKIDGGLSENEDEMKKERDKYSEKMRLTDITRIFGGCHYLSRVPGSTHAVCEVCQATRKNALPEHAYTHMEHPPFACPFCDTQMPARKNMVVHIRDVHKEMEAVPIDNRLKYAVELKETIRRCYSAIFVDAEMPSNNDLVRLSRGADEVALREDEPEE